jgi:hypothetical protein
MDEPLGYRRLTCLLKCEIGWFSINVQVFDWDRTHQHFSSIVKYPQTGIAEPLQFLKGSNSGHSVQHSLKKSFSFGDIF